MGVRLRVMMNDFRVSKRRGRGEGWVSGFRGVVVVLGEGCLIEVRFYSLGVYSVVRSD